MRPPLTVVLINNGGGGIFSFLPIADHVPEDVFTPLWATPQNVDLAGMCRAHGIPHVKVSTSEELRAALKSAWGLNRHSVIEAITDRGSNVDNHRRIQEEVKKVIKATDFEGGLEVAFDTLNKRKSLRKEIYWPNDFTPYGSGVPENVFIDQPYIFSATLKQFELPMRRSMTVPRQNDQESDTEDVPAREGILFILEVRLPMSRGNKSSEVAGEISPLPGLHRETLEEARAQAELLSGLLALTMLPESAAHFESWLSTKFGIDADELLPSVRFGVEAAVLSAIAVANDVSLAQVLNSSGFGSGSRSTPYEKAVAVNAMIDPQGDVIQAKEQAETLKAQNQSTCIKIKVGRVADPMDDAAAVLAIRELVGPHVQLRADANRAWTLEQAVVFGTAVQFAGLQYIEEPLKNPTHASLDQFFFKTGIAIALDESIDEGLFGFDIAQSRKHTLSDNGNRIGSHISKSEELPVGVTAVVLKPSALGGLLQTSRLAKLARARGANVVISSAFESPVGLLHLAHLATVQDPRAEMHHGLGTGDWWNLKVSQLINKEHSDELINTTHQRTGLPIEDSLERSNDMIKQLREMVHSPSAAHPFCHIDLKKKLPLEVCCAASVFKEDYREYIDNDWDMCKDVVVSGGIYKFKFINFIPGNGHRAYLADSMITGESERVLLEIKRPVVFLHGFLGQPNEWEPFMRAFAAAGHQCVSISLPGHGTEVFPNFNLPTPFEAFSLENTAEGIAALLRDNEMQGCIVVGYSLGARIALFLGAKYPNLMSSVVSISGSAGLEDPALREERAAIDKARGKILVACGFEAFISSWYQAPMWDTLTAQKLLFSRILDQRTRSVQIQETVLSWILENMSPGRAPAVGKELCALAAEGNMPQLLLVAGEADDKFVRMNAELKEQILMAQQAQPGNDEISSSVEAVVVPGCGHTVHIERPMALLKVLQSFI